MTANDLVDRIDRAAIKLKKAGKRLEESGRLRELYRKLCDSQWEQEQVQH